jgi:metal-responsive CopG/Arc/MetJ family transcriptional regulator
LRIDHFHPMRESVILTCEYRRLDYAEVSKQKDMLGTMTTENVRLNYTISEELETSLTDYCELTGRSASDLVRQLICEVIEEDRTLPPAAEVITFDKSSPRRERRTDMWVSPMTLQTFDRLVEDGGYPSKSAVIALLLTEFLKNRTNHAGEEMVRVTALIDRLTYTKLNMVGAAQNKRVEEVIYDLCREHIAQLGGQITQRKGN